MNQQFQYEDVEQYLRSFSTKEPPDDFGSLLRLVLVGVENLRANVAEGDILDHAHYITDEQAVFLRQLLEHRAESKAWFLSEITHSSQVLHGL
jgi:hypothetical protein